MWNRNISYSLLPLVVIFFIFSCGTNPQSENPRQASYESSARANERVAQDWRDMGNDSMADYYEQQAEEARHNKQAADCGLLSYFLFDVIFRSEKCK